MRITNKDQNQLVEKIVDSFFDIVYKDFSHLTERECLNSLESALVQLTKSAADMGLLDKPKC